MIRDILRSTPLRTLVADILGMICLAIVIGALVLVGRVLVP